MPAISIYGIAIKYTIPLLMPAAALWPSSFSKTARHIAHCASAGMDTKRTKINMINTLFLDIVRRNHDVNHHTRNSHIQPQRERDLCYFFMLFNIIGDTSYIGNQYKRNDNNRH